MNKESFTLAEVAEHLPAHIFWKDKEGRYLGCNLTRALALGLPSSKAVIGKTDADFMPQNIAHTILNHDLMALTCEDVLFAQESFINFMGEKLSLMVNRTQLKNEQGNTVGVYGIAFDITKTPHPKQQFKAETALNNILTNLPGHIYWKDLNSVFLGCNDLQAKSAGFKNRFEIVGKTDYEMPWKRDADLLRKSDLEVMHTKQTITVEEESQLANTNKISTFLSKKSPLLDEQGNIVGILGISFDISDRKEIEKELKSSKIAAEAANHAKTEFIANMSHDIRTPLTGVVGMSELLEDSVENTEQKQYAHWLHDSGNQLLSMLNSILEVVSADHVKEKDLNKKNFDLHQCIQDLIQLEKPTTELKHLALKVDIESSVPQYIISDRTKLHRILLNLLGNAIKFTKTGQIIIEVKCLKSTDTDVQLQFGVADTGIGIPKDAQDKVFDRFFRVTPSYKGIYEGYGIGLHIVQSYVTLLGGHITLTSQENVGTTFNFDLTCKIGNVQDAQPEETPPLPAPLIKPSLPFAIAHQHAPYVLLIEDNLIAMKILQSAVTKAGFRFEAAGDGEHALELATTHEFNLIISDIGLPGISGHEFTRRLRAWEITQHKNPLPIVGLTGHAKETALQESLDSGMSDVFSKPITPKILETLKKTYIHSQSEPSIEAINTNATESKACPLGIDLPNTEAELFLLEQFPLFDSQDALKNVGDENVLREILQLMVTQEIPEFSLTFQTLFTEKNWDAIETLAHKMKGGAVYAGTVKLKYACQYLERYKKAGYTSLLNMLYDQLMQIMQETKPRVEAWLEK